MSWGAIFVAASTARIAHTTPAAAALVSAIGCGSFTWFAALSIAIAIVRHRLGQRGLSFVDAVSGLGIMLFADLLGWRTVGHT